MAAGIECGMHRFRRSKMVWRDRNSYEKVFLNEGPETR
jgi:hypothetical protein